MCRVLNTRNWINETTMRLQRKIVPNSNFSVPSVFQHNCFFAEQIPQWASSEMEVIDEVNDNLGGRVAEPELLVQFVVLCYKPCSLYSDILLHTVQFVCEVVTQMESSLNPGKGNTAKLYTLLPLSCCMCMESVMLKDMIL